MYSFSALVQPTLLFLRQGPAGSWRTNAFLFTGATAGPGAGAGAGAGAAGEPAATAVTAATGAGAAGAAGAGAGTAAFFFTRHVLLALNSHLQYCTKIRS